MRRRSPSPVVRTVTDAMWRRDALQMRAAGALLSAMGSRTGGPPVSVRAAAKTRGAARRWDGFRSVLCAIDFSAHSRQALRHAEAIALRDGAALTVVHAADPLLVAAAAAALHDADVPARRARELRAFVDATLSVRSPLRKRLTTRVSIGSPAAEILKAAARGRCDLIVLGTQGLTAARRLFLGSTTAGVLQRATVPVLAVPSGAGAPRRP